VQCTELLNFLPKDVMGARSSQRLGRLDACLKKKNLWSLPSCQNESVRRYTKVKTTEG